MGKIIVIEGSCDSVGKSTQYNLLVDRLQKEKIDIVTHHFPSYGTYQARATEEYLRGSYGNISNLSPYFINSLYATDRAITFASGLKNEYDKGKILLFDRYNTSTLIYQSVSIDDEKEREEFIDYVYDYEHNKLLLPKPDLVIFLYVPFEIAYKLKEERKIKSNKKEDIYERDIKFMEKVSEFSTSIAKKYNWQFVECSKDGKMKTIEDIHEEIYKLVKKKIL